MKIFAVMIVVIILAAIAVSYLAEQRDRNNSRETASSERHEILVKASETKTDYQNIVSRLDNLDNEMKMLIQARNP